MRYEIIFTNPAQKDCKRLPKNILNKIEKSLEEDIAHKPYDLGFKLKADLEGFYSYELPPYRIGHRKDIYRKSSN